MKLNPGSLLTMHRHLFLLSSVFFAGAALAGCGMRQSAEGTFDKTLTVQGPLRLELYNGSGDSRVVVGGNGQVEIHGEAEVKDWSESGSRDQLRQLQSEPPIKQEGGIIRVGRAGTNSGGSSIDYTITVPANTEFKGVTADGGLSVTGLQGAVTVQTSSGDVAITQIGGDVRVTSGSGDLSISDVAGQVQANSGSGDVTLAYPKGEVRIETGDGNVQITRPGDAATVQTGDGDVEISDASPDLSIHTSSGQITVSGAPRSGAYWEFHAVSGDITLNVPSSSSFQLYAHSISGDIDTQIPIMMEGTTSSHELRARVGDGAAHVEAGTSSGSIAVH
ncbi:MAG TPA: DUF4097 family beta strand repeat-containing protein [Verrucomicrobiae bacterium]|nr:DUF4097 family beta strand repeat-containing protein [Verrucomicrobiae bacterium]